MDFREHGIDDFDQIILILYSSHQSNTLIQGTSIYYNDVKKDGAIPSLPPHAL
jgi:hypothetical protein